MRRALFTRLVLATGLAAAPVLSAQEASFPAGIVDLQATQVISGMLDLREVLMLSSSQVSQLSTLRAAFRAERSRFGPGPRTLHPGGGPISSSRAAYRKAEAILTPAQRTEAFRLLDQVPGRTTVAEVPDPLAHHAAGTGFPPARKGSGGRSNHLIHETGDAPVVRAQAGHEVMGNPVTHRE